MSFAAHASKLGAFVRADAQPTVIARERFGECFTEAWPLLERHWQEIAHYADITLNVDTERYERADEADQLRIYTARVGGTLVGYAVFFVAPNGHYQQSVQAVQDVLYVHPDYRRGTIGVRLLRESERALKAEGVQAVYHHVKVRHPRLGELLQCLGYEPVDIVYAKRMD